MSALLWTLMAFGLSELLGLIWLYFRGARSESTPLSRAIGTAYAIGLGLWAFWLYAKGGAA